MKQAMWSLVVLCLVVGSGCGDESSTNTDAGVRGDAGGDSGSGGNDTCTQTFAVCPDLSMPAYDVCFGPGNTTCWYAYQGTRYTCASCATTDGCSAAATELIADVCN